MAFRVTNGTRTLLLILDALSSVSAFVVTIEDKRRAPVKIGIRTLFPPKNTPTLALVITDLNNPRTIVLFLCDFFFCLKLS